VEARRAPPTRLTQAGQVLVQDRVLGRVLAQDRPIKPPLVLKVVSRARTLQRLMGRVIGMGVRPEHVSAAIRGGAHDRDATTQ
jgi:hypothetical protein